jgi:A118 family predicted phage portal protein
MDYSGIVKYIRNKYDGSFANAKYYTYIGRWQEWYEGFVKDVHSVKISNGLNIRDRKIYRLKMAKRVCEDWASSVLNEDFNIVVNSTNEKSSILVQGSKGNKGVLGTNNFKTQLSDILELTFALGTGAIVLGLDNIGVDEDGNIIDTTKAKIDIKTFSATRIIPISFYNGVIEEAAFISQGVLDNKVIYIVSIHKKEYNEVDKKYYYTIYNDILSDTFEQLNINYKGILPVIKTSSENPLFYILKTNIANNIDIDSPMGISVYSEAEDNLAGCDIVYDACLREVITGQRIVMMNKCLLTTDEEGKPIAPQDVKQTYMQFFGDDASDVNEYIKEFHPSLNTEDLNNELQTQLNILSDKVGLGVGYYRLDQNATVTTATQYIGNKQDQQRNVSKMTNSIIETLEKMIGGILWIGKNILKMNVDDNAKVTINKNDGIVEDDTTKREQDRKDVEMGIMSKAEYRAKWYGETIEEAEKKVVNTAQ